MAKIALFTNQVAAAISGEFDVVDKAMVGCNITGSDKLLVLREELDGGFKQLTIDGKDIILSKHNNEILLQGPQKYKTELPADSQSGPISNWYQI